MKQTTEQPQAAHGKEYYEGYLECSRRIEDAIVKRIEQTNALLGSDESMNILALAKKEKFLELTRKRRSIRSKITAYVHVADICNEEWLLAAKELRIIKNKEQ